MMKEITITLTAADWEQGRKNLSQNLTSASSGCAVAVAIRRTTGAEYVSCGPCTAVIAIEEKDNATDYRLPDALSSAIMAFDRRDSFPGEITATLTAL